jgi:hypothetical protein
MSSITRRNSSNSDWRAILADLGDPRITENVRHSLTETAATPLGNAAHIAMHIRRHLFGAAPTLIRLTKAIQPIDRPKWPEHNGQEQLCDPLIPKNTFWYYSDSRVIPMPAPSCA